MRYKLLTRGEQNPKTALCEAYGWEVAILHLAPACSSGYEVCPNRSLGCTRACLNFIGQGRYPRVQACRIRRTKLWFENRQEFKATILADIAAHVRHCKRKGLKPAIRPNGTSDIAWEKEFPEVFKVFPQVQFYDYTKDADRCMKSYKLPRNYHLVFSKTEDNDKQVSRVLRSGKCSVAVVFRADGPEDVPTEYKSKPVVFGDNHDLQFLHPNNSIIALKAKGLRARQDKTGFVVRPS